MPHHGANSLAAGAACNDTAGSMRERFQHTDWNQTSLGPSHAWDPALTHAVSLCLDSCYAQLVLAGPELICLYNDAAAALLETKHPQAFARPAHEVWPETWNVIGPMLQGVQRSGVPVRRDDMPLLVQLGGFEQYRYFTFSYSPVRSIGAQVVAVLVVTLDTTARVLQERRLRLLNRLASAIAGARSLDQTFTQAALALSSDPEDLPLCALYMCEQDGALRLAFVAGQDQRAGMLARMVPAAILRSVKLGQAELFDLPESLEPGAQERMRAVALPISLPGALTSQGVFVVGLGPRLLWDDDYQSFLGLVLSHLGTGLAANEAAHETGSFLSIVFDNAPSGIAIADANGVLIRANDAYARLFRVRKEDLAGTPMRIAFSAASRENPRSLQQLLEQAASGRTHPIRYARSDDGDVWVAEQMSLVRDSRGEPKFVVITTKDITETVLAKQEAQAARDELSGLYQRLQTIREEERVAIAREVHDQLGQVLSAAKIDIDLLADSLTRQASLSAADMLGELHSAQAALDRALQLVKAISGELRSARVQDKGLFAATRWHARDFERRTRCRCRVLIAPGLHEPEGTAAVTLFRIMQEALTNVLRHAAATEVTVSFQPRGDAVKLRVRDNGVGISRGALRDPSALGVRGMRERAALHGGRLLVGALPAAGTLVSALVPRQPDATRSAL